MGNVVRLHFGRTKAGKQLPKPKLCRECEEPIETARLQVQVGVRYCLACQTALERRRARALEGARASDVVIIRGR